MVDFTSYLQGLLCFISLAESLSSDRKRKSSRRRRKRRRKTSSTGEKGTAASKTGNTDYVAHLGAIHTETQSSQGSKRLKKGRITSCTVCKCPHQDHPQEEYVSCEYGVQSSLKNPSERTSVRLLLKSDASFCPKTPGRGRRD